MTEIFLKPHFIAKRQSVLQNLVHLSDGVSWERLRWRYCVCFSKFNVANIANIRAVPWLFYIPSTLAGCVLDSYGLSRLAVCDRLTAEYFLRLTRHERVTSSTMQLPRSMESAPTHRAFLALSDIGLLLILLITRRVTCPGVGKFRYGENTVIVDRE